MFNFARVSFVVLSAVAAMSASAADLKCPEGTKAVVKCVADPSPNDSTVLANSVDAATVCQNNKNEYSMMLNSPTDGPAPDALPATLDDGDNRPGAGKTYSTDLGEGVTLTLSLPGAVSPAYRNVGKLSVIFPGGIVTDRKMKCER